jgi:DNA-binding GntR family transcriptional regulator
VPLTHQDLHGIYRLRHQIEPEIASRSCLLLKDENLERLDDVVKTFADERLGIEEVYEAHHNFRLELLRPAATEWDIRTLETLRHAAERYVRLAFSGLDASPDEHSPTRTRPPPDDRRLPKPRSRGRFRIPPPPRRRQRAIAQRAIV